MVVRWYPVTPGQAMSTNETRFAQHKMVSADARGTTVEDLELGVSYKFVVEAVVSVKTTTDGKGGITDPEAEKAVCLFIATKIYMYC